MKNNRPMRMDRLDEDPYSDAPTAARRRKWIREFRGDREEYRAANRARDGGTGGIGRAVAIRLAHGGDRVIFVGETRSVARPC